MQEGDPAARQPRRVGKGDAEAEPHGHGGVGGVAPLGQDLGADGAALGMVRHDVTHLEAGHAEGWIFCRAILTWLFADKSAAWQAFILALKLKSEWTETSLGIKNKKPKTVVSFKESYFNFNFNLILTWDGLSLYMCLGPDVAFLLSFWPGCKLLRLTTQRIKFL